MGKNSLLIIAATDSRNDPRVWRQICYLKDEYDITVVALTDPNVRDVKFIPITKRYYRNVFVRFYIKHILKYWKHIKKDYFWQMDYFTPVIAENTGVFDIVICNDMLPLGLAMKLAGGSPVIFDAHEYYPLEFENSREWLLSAGKFNEWICKTFIPKCAAITTVSEGLLEGYKNNFGCAPVIIRNIPEFENLEPKPLNGQIKMIHHGGAIADRHLDLMLETMKYLDERFTLDLMLVGGGEYYEKIKTLAMNTPRVNWLQPVAMQDIAKKCNEYDIGIFILPETGFNTKYALPNKLFEFIQARLAIAIGPSVEMAKIVRKHNLGIISPDFTPLSMAEALNSLTENDIMRFKNNSHGAAKIYNAKNEMEILKNILGDILQR